MNSYKKTIEQMIKEIEFIKNQFWIWEYYEWQLDALKEILFRTEK
jgi:hypothetical protein